MSSLKDVVFKLRDIEPAMVSAWKEAFHSIRFDCNIEISCGDIFNDAPWADAIVSPSNSFGFMDGGIDLRYSEHFGWQLQERLQNILRNEHFGELPVGEAIILQTFEDDQPEVEHDWMKCNDVNEGYPIKFVISSPTTRVPADVNNTVNAYLAFRAVCVAVHRHNQTVNKQTIRSVLCPGLATSGGQMSFEKCAMQMKIAYEVCVLKDCKAILKPESLLDALKHHLSMEETDRLA
ncbi:uncharacterized protein LOC124442343 [Xenia sp. Carnegie-2017]|uniref:uncharacterized protein LOC124442343 n=1 Tax=Xenia sp. Carnegie-2017 TaxID=2897299 RepID=UPI001F044281|nr:uncharacterized protein LOC124442343 [Xenia sp. Carnegie-2017]